mgnify:CR=1 FL=1
MSDWFSDWPTWKFFVYGGAIFLGFSFSLARQEKNIFATIFYSTIIQGVFITILSAGFTWADKGAEQAAIERKENEFKQFKEFMIRYNGERNDH